MWPFYLSLPALSFQSQLKSEARMQTPAACSWGRIRYKMLSPSQFNWKTFGLYTGDLTRTKYSAARIGESGTPGGDSPPPESDHVAVED
ncbi:hypothetical protein DL98DRAFT_600224 [Cadophora sp. DSE1049]|nr:hypothetical protein DL98DRAFT_600224 [Cadophora sp. DSE1049]